MDTQTLKKYHEQLGVALEGENRLAAVERLYAEMDRVIWQKETGVDTQNLLERVNRQIASDEADIAKFAETLTENPTHAVRWSYSMIDAATRLEHLRRVRMALEAGAPIDDIITELVDAAWRIVRYPPSSSSVMSNLVDQSVGTQAASLLKHLFGIERPHHTPRT